MNAFTVTALLAVVFLAPAFGQDTASCDEFRELVKSTYNFKPSKLSPLELNRKSQEMDRLWAVVGTKPDLMMPCLSQALQAADADPWFLFDGGMLLVQHDPSPAAKEMEVRGLNVVDLADVNLRTWVAAVAERAAEGFDLSEAGANWLAYTEAEYDVPEFARNVDTAMGALFIYGSMDETRATPALLKIVAQPKHPGRSIALKLLVKQATPESLKALRQMKSAPERLDLVLPRAKPKVSRDQFVDAFKAAVQDDWTVFQGLLDKIPDLGKDAVAVLKPEDVTLFRQVRRKIISTANPNAIEFYDSFTKILMTLVTTRSGPSAR